MLRAQDSGLGAWGSGLDAQGLGLRSQGPKLNACTGLWLNVQSVRVTGSSMFKTQDPVQGSHTLTLTTRSLTHICFLYVIHASHFFDMSPVL